MKYLASNLRFLRKQKGITQNELADQLNVQRTMISAYEDGRSEPKLLTLGKISDVLEIGLEELLNHDIENLGRKAIQKRGVSILTIACDADEKENITLVGHKASAGYLNGYADTEYMESLPQFQIPTLSKQATYRAFELAGDSMLPLTSGTIVIGAYVDQLKDIKSGKTYVLVTDSEGVVYKRVFNYLSDNGKLFLVSDNEQYKPYEVKGEEVVEVWEAKAFISTDFPNPGDKKKPLTMEDLGEMISDIRADLRTLKG
ncbi:XRE family transcriptional regulator [Algoriphagus aquimarinus]|uniref:Transcriptional regulator, contains XRE-family HTH domain n=1 Tax=Algoriphagus aquimarinus TaxID=237018 RepID=A0A1I1BBT3_9BACT|nr:helix-turn-helix domain-containing protein [Algoriphagus aquimarinus]SFB46188.1 Transcriptional regulator, contains XRE-family HTH domain [Algoriphagus aquimarinus]|tara:strand:- start:111821 stop:112594 length:774 start_codon:yes stop_codon:yes gene_type:complete